MKYEYQIHGNYGPGYEEVTCEETHFLALETLRLYRENEPGIPFKIVRRKESDHA